MLRHLLQRTTFACTAAIRNAEIGCMELANASHNRKKLSQSTALKAGSTKYEGKKFASIRQREDESPDYLQSGDQQHFAYDKKLGTTSFPTLETHSQHFNGVRFNDLPIIHIKATSNNTILTAIGGDGCAVAHQSSGTVGFRNARKGTNVAAQAAAIALADDVIRKDIKTVRVCLRGIGAGRLPALKAIQMSGIQVVSITDTTRLAHNGNRPKKARRL